MLILTRRIGERVIIADDIEIAVIGIQGGQVRLGITAPKNISVHREEIYNKIKLEGYNHRDKKDITTVDVNNEIDTVNLINEKV